MVCIKIAEGVETHNDTKKCLGPPETRKMVHDKIMADIKKVLKDNWEDREIRYKRRELVAVQNKLFPDANLDRFEKQRRPNVEIDIREQIISLTGKKANVILLEKMILDIIAEERKKVAADASEDFSCTVCGGSFEKQWQAVSLALCGRHVYHKKCLRLHIVVSARQEAVRKAVPLSCAGPCCTQPILRSDWEYALSYSTNAGRVPDTKACETLYKALLRGAQEKKCKKNAGEDIKLTVDGQGYGLCPGCKFAIRRGVGKRGYWCVRCMCWWCSKCDGRLMPLHVCIERSAIAED